MTIHPVLKKLLALVVVVLAAYTGYQQSQPDTRPAEVVQRENTALIRAIAERQSGTQVRGNGTVVRILADDNDGSRHQRFIVELETGGSLLIAHNIDLAPRVASLRVGDNVGFFGEYEWNERGGVIHWTHADPAGWHVDGWIEHRGRRYK
ncbi:MAG: DUF3465 domain-containing protein [Gammaproteobacteria bacterium]|nr:DUF3465 domain-containing protein [Gammaproteobacteria bacterium]NNL50399.1 DUF3465 domain-containing protein [Woeseiaceae bacterium]